MLSRMSTLGGGLKLLHRPVEAATQSGRRRSLPWRHGTQSYDAAITHAKMES
jgi:hypothetical protein